MAKGSVLWRRTENVDEDIWDDSDLIAAYDRAYEKIKKEIERRNRTSSENSSAGQEPSTGWKQGDYCIAVYSGDKLPYEAKIKCIRGKHCIVHYIGYGNEERVLLSDLHPSEGKKARQAQQARAGSRPRQPNRRFPASFVRSVSTDKTLREPSVFVQKQKRRHKSVHTSSVASGSSQHCAGVPNLPSEPPWGDANFGVPLSSSAYGAPPLPPHPSLLVENSPESAALSSMLMAWYMSGYHTGYYQALQQSRQKK